MEWSYSWLLEFAMHNPNISDHCGGANP